MATKPGAGGSKTGATGGGKPSAAPAADTPASGKPSSGSAPTSRPGKGSK